MAPQPFRDSSNKRSLRAWKGSPHLPWGQLNGHGQPHTWHVPQERGDSPSQRSAGDLTCLSPHKQGTAAVWSRSLQGSGSRAWQLPAH